MKVTTETENLEVRLLVEAIYRKYGYDFRNYSKASIKRRVKKRLASTGLQTIAQLQHQILYDTASFEALLLDLSVNVTEMFRDPLFFKAVRETVIPELRELPFVKIWHAGCATGEEVYSMAILLKEAGLSRRTQIYATDFNEVVLEKARKAIYPIGQLKDYSANYQQAGGTESLANYYRAQYDSVIIDSSLKDNILFADHNLVTDGVFCEADMVICRNVLIYFNQRLQSQVLSKLTDSLGDGGFLCIGSKESIQFSDCAEAYEKLPGRERVYRKKPLGGSMA